MTPRARYRPAMRRFVAWLGHAPGLWLCYREPLAPSLRRPNVVAAATTVVAIGGALVFADATAALVAWLAGHASWGTYLALKLPPRDG